MKGYRALRSFILKDLSENLSPQLTYHGIHHTKDVMAVCRQYIQRLGIKGKNAELLMIGALVHDSGFLHTYKNHEEKGVEMAKVYLPGFGYNAREIEIISGLIMATKVPQTPKTDLERILCDADLDYLGRKDFDKISDSLFQELQNFDVLHDHNEWNKLQARFLENHTFHTLFAQKNRQPKKELRVTEIKKKIL